MTKPIQVDKKKFDALLDRMLKTPPLPKAEINVKKKAATERPESASVLSRLKASTPEQRIEVLRDFQKQVEETLKCPHCGKS